MKKLTVLLLSMLLVLSIGHAAFAQANVNLAVGYSDVEAFEGFFLDASGGYKFNNWLSLQGDVLFTYGQKEQEDTKLKGFALDTDVLVKFHLYKYGFLSLGLQAGVKNIFTNLDKLSGENDLINSFSIGPGFFFDLYFAPRTNLYLDTLFPIFSVETDNGKTKTDFGFNVDLKLGVKYEINSNFDVGVEIVGIIDNDIDIATFGAKVGYKF